METYECNKFGMSINATFGKCVEKLLNDILALDNVSVQKSRCPNGHGEIKSPLCPFMLWT
tara:strand:- start:165 stop:344 length:180 start_codon:yes stop_codon:yes gene_type:complete